MHPHLMPFVLGAAIASAALAQPAELLTVAERSEFKATAHHADVVKLLDALAAASPRATRASLGATNERRDIPLLLLADPPVHSPDEARAQVERDGKVLVFVIGNIHAGEVCGKEALPILAREVLFNADDRLLDHAIIAMAPIYNCDGNERFGNNRPTQNGPEQGEGVRENAQGLDLNRDFIKLEAPETRGLVKFLNDWDPHLFIDCHTTNGAYHRYTVTYGTVKSLAGDAALRRFAHDEFIPGFSAIYTRLSGEPTFWYGTFGASVFEEAPDDRAHWAAYSDEARFGTTYVGLRGRLSLLSEAYTYAPYKDRVLRTRDFVRAAIRWCSEQRDEVRRVTRAASDAARAGDSVVIRSRLSPCPGTHTVLGYEEEMKDGHAVRTDRPKDYSVQLVDCFEPEKAVARPAGYLIPRDERLEPVVERLRLHGIKVDEVNVARRAAGERYTILKATPASRPFQNHVLAGVEASATPGPVDLREGDWYVSTAQPLSNLIVYLLEPECEDGLTTWNFFDPWLHAGDVFPVVRVMEGPGGNP